jgi:hypothetical protein
MGRQLLYVDTFIVTLVPMALNLRHNEPSMSSSINGDILVDIHHASISRPALQAEIS